MSSDIIELVNVRKTYRRGSEQILAVDDASLAVADGEFVAIVGPSGSGKTTLLNLIGCVDEPDGGVVRVDGVETTGLTERALTAIRARTIGFVFQQFFLLPTLTVAENVDLPALFAARRGRDESAGGLLERVGLAARARHLPAQLSGGEMQRVAIARALRNRPKILVADEPTGSLDSRTARGILEIFRELNSAGLTIVMVTHNLELAREARRLVEVRDGRVRAATDSVAALHGPHTELPLREVGR